MNTPAHAVVDMWVLGRRGRPLWPYALGGILPDVPIIVFYGWERLLRGASEGEIWRRLYFQAGWQHVFDGFHSLPLLAAAWLLFQALRARRTQAVVLGMGLHAICDIPLHNADAHRPFWPLSDWRFVSPISYWDPRHYGIAFAVAELALVVVGTIVLWRRFPTGRSRLLIALTAASYGAFLVFVALTWA